MQPDRYAVTAALAALLILIYGLVMIAARLPGRVARSAQKMRGANGRARLHAPDPRRARVGAPFAPAYARRPGRGLAQPTQALLRPDGGWA